MKVSNDSEGEEYEDGGEYSFTGKLDAKLLNDIFPDHPKELTEKLLPHLNNHLKGYSMNSCEERIHFFTQIATESNNLNDMSEIKSKYASSKSKYKGRGIIQLTGKANYEPFQEYIKTKKRIFADIINNPDLVATDMNLAVLSAFWYWRVEKNKSKTLSNNLSEQSLLKISKLVNCGNPSFCIINGKRCDTCLPNGYDRRKIEFQRLKQKFNCNEYK